MTYVEALGAVLLFYATARLGVALLTWRNENDR